MIETHAMDENGNLGAPIREYETIIGTRGGVGIAAFTRPHRYPASSATGWHYTGTAYVWLTDRVCRWACPCDCGHPRTDIAHAPDRNPARPIVYEAVVLPGLDLLPA